METIINNSQKKEQFSFTTKILAGLCHNCGICPYARIMQNSTFEKIMRWHRTWCPAWAAHTRVYGLKNLG